MAVAVVGVPGLGVVRAAEEVDGDWEGGEGGGGYGKEEVQAVGCVAGSVVHGVGWR